MARPESLARNKPGPAQTLASWTALAVLVLAGAYVFYSQYHYDPARWGLAPPPQVKAGAAPRLLAHLGPEAYVPLGPVESFGPETLSDKIDGKAELYLPAGFRLLETRRFAPASDPKAWLEIYAYDMGKADNAFAVFSAQRRSGGKPLDLTANAYQSGGAVFLTHGPYYLEVIGSRPDLGPKGRSLAKAFVRNTVLEGGGSGGGGGPADLLPKAGRREGSLTLLAKDAFGMAGLDQVYLAEYPVGEEVLMAFASKRADPAQAVRLRDDYAALLLASGGKEEPAPEGLPGARLVDILGTWELLMARGDILAGVRGGENREATLKLGRDLAAALPGAEAK